MKLWSAFGLALLCCAFTACNSAVTPSVPSGIGSAAGLKPATVLRHRRPIVVRYRIVDLGQNVQPTRVNNLNAVVGYQTLGYGNPTPVLFQHGKLTNLGVFPGDVYAEANDINDAGEIVGTSIGGSTQHAVLFHPGAAPTLLYTPTSQYPAASANAINATGKAVGWIGGGAPCGPGAVFTGGGGALALPDIEYAVAVNDNGSIAGYAPFVGAGGCNGESTAYEINPTRQLPFPTNEAGIQGVVPSDINDRGTIVGEYDYCNVTSGPYYGCEVGGFFNCAQNDVAACGYAGYVYRNGKIESIYSPKKNAACLYLSGINNSGEMVGAICEPATAQRAVRVVGTHVTDLNTLMPANCSWVLDEATDVNDRGVIVGVGKLNGIYHGFMLVPRV